MPNNKNAEGQNRDNRRTITADDYKANNPKKEDKTPHIQHQKTRTMWYQTILKQITRKGEQDDRNA